MPARGRIIGILLGGLLATCVLAQSSSPAEMARAVDRRAGDERRAVSAANAMNALIFPALAAAATYDELWQAMQFSNTRNFRDDIGTIHAAPAAGDAFDLENQPAFLAMVARPIGEIGLRWQHGGPQDVWAQLDDALSQQLRAQVQRIRDAQSGIPAAQQEILAARKAFALAHGSVFGHSPREYLTAQEWVAYQATQAAAEYRLQHPDLGPGSNSP
jgi:hypothetical protein